MHVAIFGAAGAVGRNLVQPLLAHGHSVRLVGRRLAVLDAIAPGRAESVSADLNDPAQACAAARGADAIVYCAGQPYDHFERHTPMTATCLDAARAEGVGRFILISNVYPYGKPQTATVAETHPRAPHTKKGAYRKQQEDVVLAAHDPAGLRTLSLRPGDFYGPDAELSFVRSAFDNAIAGGTCDLVGPIDAPHEFVFMPDLAEIVARIVDRDDAYGTAYNVPSAGSITTRELAKLAYDAAGNPLRLRAANKLVIRAMGIANPIFRELVEMHYLWTEPVFLDGAKVRAVLGDVPTTPYADGVAATIAAMRAASLQTSRVA